MMFRTNILALAGGGKSPKYSANKVVIWNDKINKTMAEFVMKDVIK